MTPTSAPGVLLLAPDATVCRVDAAAASLLETDRAALPDGTAGVLDAPVRTDDGSAHASLRAFLDHFRAAEASTATLTLAGGQRAEVRATYGAGDSGDVVLLVAPASSAPCSCWTPRGRPSTTAAPRACPRPSWTPSTTFESGRASAPAGRRRTTTSPS